jgi:hypothetical protein
MIRCAKSRVTVAGMDKDMNQMTRKQVLEKLRRRYETAGAEHKRKLLDQAVQLLGYHRKAASPAVSATTKEVLRQKKAGVNPFALKLAVNQHMKEIEIMRRGHPH